MRIHSAASIEIGCREDLEVFGSRVTAAGADVRRGLAARSSSARWRHDEEAIDQRRTTGPRLRRGGPAACNPLDGDGPRDAADRRGRTGSCQCRKPQPARIRRCQSHRGVDRGALRRRRVRASRGPRPHARSYRREAQRFLLWLQVERGIGQLADARVEDCVAYKQFLSDPQPAAEWCGPRGEPSGHRVGGPSPGLCAVGRSTRSVGPVLG